jgi:hypothetical protein
VTTISQQARPGAGVAGRRAVAAATLFTVAVLVHNFDHVRRGIDAVHRDVFWAGTLSIGLEVAIVVLLIARHRFAPLVAVAGGFGLALGYLIVHFLPARAWLSDSFSSHTGSVGPMSWFAASLEVVAALVVGVVGLLEIRELGGVEASVAPRADQRPWREAFMHPTALTMMAGNAIVLIISFAKF